MLRRRSLEPAPVAAGLCADAADSECPASADGWQPARLDLRPSHAVGAASRVQRRGIA